MLFDYKVFKSLVIVLMSISAQDDKLPLFVLGYINFGLFGRSNGAKL